MSLTQGASGHKNYFHWLYDILPKINICSKNYDLRKIDYFYLSKLEKYQKSSLEILGYDNIKIIDSNISNIFKLMKLSIRTSLV